MNIIVSNMQKQLIDNANIDAIKNLNGLFLVDDLINKVKNYFFNKLILDATSVMNFTSDEVIEKLAKEIGNERLYILLPSMPEPSKEFIEKLVSLHIYNYSSDINELVNFLAVPNTYNKIVDEQANDVSGLYVDNSVKELPDENVEDEIKDFDDEENDTDIEMDEQPSSNRFLNVSVNDTPNNYYNGRKIILGFKNVTIHAGSTTLCYLLYKLLKSANVKVDVFEVNRDDFKYYQDNKMVSVTEDEIASLTQNSKADIIIIDLNDCRNISVCTDTFYLVEPSVIKLNKMMIDNRYAFRELYGKKIILNKSLLSNNDVKMLSSEAGVAFFYNIPPLNDRVENDILKDLLHKMGIN